MYAATTDTTHTAIADPAAANVGLVAAPARSSANGQASTAHVTDWNR